MIVPSSMLQLRTDSRTVNHYSLIIIRVHTKYIIVISSFRAYLEKRCFNILYYYIVSNQWHDNHDNSNHAKMKRLSDAIGKTRVINRVFASSTVFTILVTCLWTRVILAILQKYRCSRNIYLHTMSSRRESAYRFIIP